LKLNKTQSEFDLEDYEDKIKNEFDRIVEAVNQSKQIRNHVLVFCTSIKQANALQKFFEGSAVVTSETGKCERNKIIKDFKAGKIPVVFNVSVLTVGFDFPELHCIVLARPTRSLRLHLQILGRGTRLHEDKQFCLIVDLAGNVKSLGKLEEIKVVKKDGWNVVSPAQPDGFHMKPLFSFLLKENDTL
jgi:superfamily II DNA or RNA helicase